MNAQRTGCISGVDSVTDNAYTTTKPDDNADANTKPADNEDATTKPADAVTDNVNATDMPDGELASATDAAVAQAGLAIALCAPVFFQMFL